MRLCSKEWARRKMCFLSIFQWFILWGTSEICILKSNSRYSQLFSPEFIDFWWQTGVCVDVDHAMCSLTTSLQSHRFEQKIHWKYPQTQVPLLSITSKSQMVIDFEDENNWWCTGNSPDFVTSSHTNPLWDWAVLF